jgi:hypothetical protein
MALANKYMNDIKHFIVIVVNHPTGIEICDFFFIS